MRPRKPRCVCALLALVVAAASDAALAQSPAEEPAEFMPKGFALAVLHGDPVEPNADVPPRAWQGCGREPLALVGRADGPLHRLRRSS
jgi:hypothetical protein